MFRISSPDDGVFQPFHHFSILHHAGDGIQHLGVFQILFNFRVIAISGFDQFNFFVDFIFLSVAFHFLNVIKDLEWDLEQGVKGAPQRLGKFWSINTALLLGALALLFLAL